MPAAYNDSVEQMFEDAENQLSAKIVDFKSQLNSQLAFCRVGLTMAKDAAGLEQAKGAVDILAATLIRQTRKNKKYKRKMEALCRQHENYLKSMPASKRQGMIFALEKQFYITKFSYLIDCMIDEGFGYNEEISEEIDVRGERGVRKEISQKEKDELASMSKVRKPTEEVFEGEDGEENVSGSD